MTAIPLTPAINFLISKNTDLSVRQLAVLMDCVGQPQTVRGIAQTRKLSKPAVTRAADRLCKEGLLVRKPDGTDKRSVLLALTSQGKRFAANFV